MKTSKAYLQKMKIERRHKRIRARVSGTADMPRLAIFKSNRYMYAQLIDDVAGKTLAAATSLKMKGTLMEKAAKVGEEVAKAGIAKGVTKVVCDRGGFKYVGRVKALADGARAGGLKF